MIEELNKVIKMVNVGLPLLYLTHFREHIQSCGTKLDLMHTIVMLVTLDFVHSGKLVYLLICRLRYPQTWQWIAVSCPPDFWRRAHQYS